MIDEEDMEEAPEGFLFRSGESTVDNVFVQAVRELFQASTKRRFGELLCKVTEEEDGLEDLLFGSSFVQAADVRPFVQVCERFFPDQPVHVKAEVYGKGVQDLTYGLQGLQVKAFDVYVGRPGIGRWLAFDEKVAFLKAADIPMVDVLYRGPHSLAEMARHRDGKTVTGNGFHIREGIVITPVTSAASAGSAG